MKDPKFSVVITSYRRQDTIKSVIEAWKGEKADITLADCSTAQNWPIFSDVRHVKIHPDPGNRFQYAAAGLTTGDFVILADDDVMPRPGILKDLYNGWKMVGGGLVGIIGRQFQRQKIYYNTVFFRASKLTDPVPVDFVGVIYFTPREYLFFDTRGMQSPVNDLFWQLKTFPYVKKHVIPTKNYYNLPTANDSECLFHDKKARLIREAFYKEYYYDRLNNGGK